jgi:hypothetical protein
MSRAVLLARFRNSSFFSHLRVVVAVVTSRLDSRNLSMILGGCGRESARRPQKSLAVDVFTSKSRDLCESVPFQRVSSSRFTKF